MNESTESVRTFRRHYYDIQSVLEEKYAEYLIDEDTGLIKQDIRTVLEYIFSNYGKLPLEEVK